MDAGLEGQHRNAQIPTDATPGCIHVQVTVCMSQKLPHQSCSFSFSFTSDAPRPGSLCLWPLLPKPACSPQKCQFSSALKIKVWVPTPTCQHSSKLASQTQVGISSAQTKTDGTRPEGCHSPTKRAVFHTCIQLKINSLSKMLIYTENSSTSRSTMCSLTPCHDRVHMPQKELS